MTIMGRKIAFSSNMIKELESCSKTLVSSKNSFRFSIGSLDFFSVRLATTDSTGGSGTGGVKTFAAGVTDAWRLAAGLAGRVAGVLISGASGIAVSGVAETMAPMRVGNLGSGI